MNLAQRTLTRRLLALLMLPTAVCLGAYAALEHALTRRELLREAERELEDHVALLGATIAPLDATLEPARFAQITAQVAARQRIHGIGLYTQRCEVIARSSDFSASAGPVDALACELAGTSEASSREGLRRVLRVGGGEVLARAVRVSGGAHVAVVVVGHDLSDLAALERRALLRAVGAGLLLAGAMAVLAVLLARRVGRSLGALVHSAERVAEGDLEARLDEEPDGLLLTHRVAQSYNAMIASLARARGDVDAAQAQRAEVERGLRHAQTLAAVGQVAASLAHDVRSPLSTILGWARLSADDDALSDETRAQFAQIATQSERITRVLERMLSLARPPQARRSRVDAAGVVREVAEFLRPECRRRGVDLRVVVAAGLPPLWCVRDELLHILMNLAVNALQAQPLGGVLVLAARPSAPSDDAVLLEVRDAGAGFSDEARARAFEPFFTTRAEQGGTGLGLPIVAQLAAAMGGSVELSRADEGGACVRVRLPSDEGDEAAGSEASRAV